VIGFLRLLGVLNAGIWLGGNVFFALVISPALDSSGMKAAIPTNSFLYFAPKIGHVLVSSYFEFSIVCAIIALLHLLMEWLYLGRPSRNFSFGLLAALLLFGLIGANWLQPRLVNLHNTRYSASAPASERQLAAKSYRTWSYSVTLLNWCAIAGLFTYFWRITNPSPAQRFVSSVKFRG
jgi:hypothetical protein